MLNQLFMLRSPRGRLPLQIWSVRYKPIEPVLEGSKLNLRCEVETGVQGDDSTQTCHPPRIRSVTRLEFRSAGLCRSGADSRSS